MSAQTFTPANNGDWRNEALTEQVMQNANELFVDALTTGHAKSRDLIWYTPPGNVNSRGIAFREDAARAQITASHRERIDARRVFGRDPCPMCGVRGELGCKHRRAAA